MCIMDMCDDIGGIGRQPMILMMHWHHWISSHKIQIPIFWIITSSQSKTLCNSLHDLCQLQHFLSSKNSSIATMVNYIASAATLLALTTSLTTTTIQAAERSTNLRRNDEQQTRLRKLSYGGGLSNSHFVSDTQTECEEVLEGNPPVCAIVCIEVTSIYNGETLVDETSKVNQSKCESTVEEVATDAPTFHPTYLIAEVAGIEETEFTSDIDWVGDGYKSATTTFDSNSGVVQSGGSSSKSSKAEYGSEGITAASSAKSSKGFSNGSSKSAKSAGSDAENVVISNGWSGSVQTITYNANDVLDANGWYGSAQSIEGNSVSGKSSVGSVGSSKSSKSDGLESVTTSNGWYGSAQVVSAVAGSSSKSSKSDDVESVATSNGWSGSVQIVSAVAGSSSKSSKSSGSNGTASSNKSSKSSGSNGTASSNKGGKGGDFGGANVEVAHVTVKTQSNAWRGGWQ